MLKLQRKLPKIRKSIKKCIYDGRIIPLHKTNQYSNYELHNSNIKEKKRRKKYVLSRPNFKH